MTDKGPSPDWEELAPPNRREGQDRADVGTDEWLAPGAEPEADAAKAGEPDLRAPSRKPTQESDPVRAAGAPDPKKASLKRRSVLRQRLERLERRLDEAAERAGAAEERALAAERSADRADGFPAFADAVEKRIERIDRRIAAVEQTVAERLQAQQSLHLGLAKEVQQLPDRIEAVEGLARTAAERGSKAEQAAKQRGSSTERALTERVEQVSRRLVELARYVEEHATGAGDTAERKQQEMDARIAKIEQQLADVTEGSLKAVEDRLTKAEGETERRLAELGGEVGRRLAKTEGDIDSRLAKTEGEIDSRLAKTEGEIDSRLSKAEGETERRLARTEKEIDGLAAIAEQVEARFASIEERVGRFARQNGDQARPPSPPPTRDPVRQRPASTTTPARAGSRSASDLEHVDFEQLRELGLSVTESARLLAMRDIRGGFESIAELESLPFSDEVITKLRDGLIAADPPSAGSGQPTAR